MARSFNCLQYLFIILNSKNSTFLDLNSDCLTATQLAEEYYSLIVLRIGQNIEKISRDGVIYEIFYPLFLLFSHTLTYVESVI